jgi:hypothetical protein
LVAEQVSQSALLCSTMRKEFSVHSPQAEKSWRSLLKQLRCQYSG